MTPLFLITSKSSILFHIPLWYSVFCKDVEYWSCCFLLSQGQHNKFPLSVSLPNYSSIPFSRSLSPCLLLACSCCSCCVQWTGMMFLWHRSMKTLITHHKLSFSSALLCAYVHLHMQPSKSLFLYINAASLFCSVFLLLLLMSLKKDHERVRYMIWESEIHDLVSCVLVCLYLISMNMVSVT